MSEKLRPVTFIVDALRWEINYDNASRSELGILRLTKADIVAYIVGTLFNGSRTRDLVSRYSSFQYGRELFYKVYPNADNQDKFHSRNNVIALYEHPAQVIGIAEYDACIAEGVAKGLTRQFIEIGFESEAQIRGIDLEWSFSANVPASTAGGLRAPGTASPHQHTQYQLPPEVRGQDA